MIKQLNISQTGMAFDPQTGDSFQINESAQLILSLFQQNILTETIAQRLTQEFAISYEQALTDVLEFQVQLQILGLST